MLVHGFLAADDAAGTDAGTGFAVGLFGGGHDELFAEEKKLAGGREGNGRDVGEGVVLLDVLGFGDLLDVVSFSSIDDLVGVHAVAVRGGAEVGEGGVGGLVRRVVGAVLIRQRHHPGRRGARGAKRAQAGVVGGRRSLGEHRPRGRGVGELAESAGKVRAEVRQRRDIAVANVIGWSRHDVRQHTAAKGSAGSGSASVASVAADGKSAGSGSASVAASGRSTGLKFTPLFQAGGERRRPAPRIGIFKIVSVDGMLACAAGAEAVQMADCDGAAQGAASTSVDVRRVRSTRVLVRRQVALYQW